MSDDGHAVAADGGAPLALFDLDNTLFDREASFRRWAEGYVSTTGLDPKEVDWFVEADQDGLASRNGMWTVARQRYDLSGTVEELLGAYRAAYLESCAPDAEVHASLSALRDAGWRIGIVTNGSMPQQADKAQRLGLLHLVDGFCASGEIGIVKPDPRIFDETIRRCTPTSPTGAVRPLWMVGDSPTADVGGARQLGVATMWMHRGRSWDATHGEEPDRTVGSIAQAVAEILGEEAPHTEPP